ncbi:MAG: 2-oxo acid dehydrogenase subunit E2 [Candidatus Marinimicrobia bacterium]|nr:2-oxo acid dehydrogenase subunit E2 [Candidatus Neomarinimicrobiota bacterium]MBL7009586.1 2-oxo acid dehydrogenase subunit E2 [Candidatus Neomarinimicrobiota bacterium]MBL7029671.1 2-oxo acid dehydrogenase subunit E2 [Candidatus Neomarinimicrobiota bacterium]
MIVDVIMPKMGESITEGTILEWRKNVGDSIELDEILLEIGTDKVDSEIPSPTAGILIEILAQPNDVLEVDTVIARIDSGGDGPKKKKLQSVKKEPEPEAAQEEKVRETPKPVQPQPNLEPKSGEKKFFTPVVNKIAAENNVGLEELMAIPGSGKGGRVTKVDILNYMESRSIPLQESQASKIIEKSPIVFSGVEEQVEMDHMRKLIAGHMRKSIDTATHVYVMSEVDMSAIVQYVSKHEDAFYKKEGFALTITPFIIQACVTALNRFPEMNASLEETTILYHKNINIGMAVAVEKGLMVPVISKCEELNFLGLCRKVRDLANRTRNKQLNPDELQGSTFSISNFGVFNVTFGTPIINQPNVGILGVGAIKKRPVVIETDAGDTIGIKSMMNLSLGFDHRLVDGAGGSQFIDDVRQNLESMNLESLI